VSEAQSTLEKISKQDGKVVVVSISFAGYADVIRCGFNIVSNVEVVVERDGEVGVSGTF
jgi:hypothetical protein